MACIYHRFAGRNPHQCGRNRKRMWISPDKLDLGRRSDYHAWRPCCLRFSRILVQRPIIEKDICQKTQGPPALGCFYTHYHLSNRFSLLLSMQKPHFERSEPGRVFTRHNHSNDHHAKCNSQAQSSQEIIRPITEYQNHINDSCDKSSDKQPMHPPFQ